MFEQYDDLLDVTEVCELLKMSRGSVYPLLISGKIPAFRNGRIWRIPKEGVIQFIRTSSKLSAK